MPTEHRIEVANGEAVAAVHHAAPGDDWLVFCHGFRSDKSGSYEGRCRRAVEEGYDAVRFDFRGCGESDGEFAASTLSARIADLRAVLAHFDPAAPVLFGSSFGGAVAFHVAAERGDVRAVATRAPVTDTGDGAFAAAREAIAATGAYEYESGERLDARFIEDLDSHEFADVAAGLDCPACLFHGAEDDSVPVAHSFEAAAALSTDTLLQKYAGEGHRFSEGAEARLRDQLFDWLGVL